jgi:hypothetical protein
MQGRDYFRIRSLRQAIGDGRLPFMFDIQQRLSWLRGLPTVLKQSSACSGFGRP